MKVCVVTAATNTIPRFRIDMIDEFVRRGCEVVVFGDEPRERWDGFFGEHGVSYRTYSVLRNGMDPAADMATKAELKKLLAEERPDKVWTYQAKPNIYGCMAAHELGIGDVYVMMGGLGSVFHAADAKSRFVRAVVSAEYRHALRHAKAVFFQNMEDVETFERLRILKRDRVVLTRGSGVNISAYPQVPFPAQMRFLFVGRLVRGKGVLDYLDAARIVKKGHPEVGFDLVGPFDSNPTALKPADIQPYIDEGTVDFHGEQKDVRLFQAASSAFVLPSYYGEGTPKSALEAMATGRPLIVADAVGCREVVKEGANGFLVPPRDPEAIAAAMTRLVEESGLKERMGAESRRLAEEVFDVCRVNDVICKTMGIENAQS